MVLLRHKSIRKGTLGVHDGKKPRQFAVEAGYALVPDDLVDKVCVTADWYVVTDRQGDYPGDDALSELTASGKPVKA